MPESLRLSAAHCYTDYRPMPDGEQLDLVAVLNSDGDRAEGVPACAERKLHV